MTINWWVAWCYMYINIPGRISLSLCLSVALSLSLSLKSLRFATFACIQWRLRANNEKIYVLVALPPRKLQQHYLLYKVQVHITFKYTPCFSDSNCAYVITIDHRASINWNNKASRIPICIQVRSRPRL